jgi:hypothetical protein
MDPTSNSASLFKLIALFRLMLVDGDITRAPSSIWPSFQTFFKRESNNTVLFVAEPANAIFHLRQGQAPLLAQGTVNGLETTGSGSSFVYEAPYS